MDNSHSDIKEKTFEATQVPLQRFSHQHRFLEDLFIFWISIGNFTVAGCTCNSEITDFVSCRLIWKRQYRSLRKSLAIVDCSFCSSWSVPIFPCKGTADRRNVKWRFAFGRRVCRQPSANFIMLPKFGYSVALSDLTLALSSQLSAEITARKTVLPTKKPKGFKQKGKN